MLRNLIFSNGKDKCQFFLKVKIGCGKKLSVLFVFINLEVLSTN